jgi:tRNA (adenine37-N6)-methyltransferase
MSTLVGRGSRSAGEGLDAIDGSPVLDVKPYMREFEPAGGDIRQPKWSTELMQGYY